MTNDEIIDSAARIVANPSLSTEGKLDDIKQLLYLLVVSTIETQRKLDHIKTTNVWGPKI